VDEQGRQRIPGQFGALLGRLHDHGFYGSTRLKDIIYAGSPDANPRLTLIDRETRNPYPKRATEKRVIERPLFNIRRQAQQGGFSANRNGTNFARITAVRYRAIRISGLKLYSPESWPCCNATTSTGCPEFCRG